MERAITLKQAETVAELLRELLRQLTTGVDDSAMELSLAQLKVCNVLYRGPRPMSALGRELGVSLSSMTQLANRLESARLVKRVARGDDRRVRCLQLTRRGEKMMRLHEEARVRRMAAVLEHLSLKARKEATTALRMLIRASAEAKGQNGDPEKRGPHFFTSKAIL